MDAIVQHQPATKTFETASNLFHKICLPLSILILFFPFFIVDGKVSPMMAIFWMILLNVFLRRPGKFYLGDALGMHLDYGVLHHIVLLGTI